MNINLREIKELSKLMDEKGLVGLEIEEQGVFRIKIEKEKGEQSFSISTSTPKLQEIAQGKTEEKLTTITSPLVGTFFRASAPENPPYVEVGDNIFMGQTLCNIVAMKTQNEVKSMVEGKILEVLVENNHPVEYGQDLFLVKLKEGLDEED